jgi:minichromosome maintenance protein 10
MQDPRDEVINSDDCLTDDSNDEVNDLVKEFEVKYAEIKRKKRDKKRDKIPSAETIVSDRSSDINELSHVGISRVRVESGANGNGNGNGNGTKSYGKSIKQPQSEDSPFMSNSLGQKASSFVNKLYESNYKRSASKALLIDYSRRVFDFDTKNIKLNQDIDVDEVDPYSNQALRKRYIESQQLNAILVATDEKLKILKISKLLAKVNKANDFAEPMYTNWCFVGSVLQKHAIKLTKSKQKFMKVSVGDFNHSVDVLFFGEALPKYWKLRPGDLIAILNPFVNKYYYQPPNSSHVFSGFNLKIDENNLNSILEIGALRDFGYCTAINSQKNTKCDNVIDKTKSDMCEFHINLKFKGVSNKRMELNGSVQMKSPKKPKFSASTANEEFVVYCGSKAGFMEEPQNYQNPKLLSQDSKRRKLLDAKANKSLEKKLASLGNSSTVKVLKLVKDQPKVSKEENDKLLETRQRGFSTEMIGKIGFDPTQDERLFDSNGTEGYKSPNRKRKEVERVRDLYELSLSQSKQKELTNSPEDRKSKHDKWKSNINNLKKYQQKLKMSEANKHTHDNLAAALNSRRKMNSVRFKENDTNDSEHFKLELGFSTSDESDLEIQFSDDDAKKQFQLKMGYMTGLK